MVDDLLLEAKLPFVRQRASTRRQDVRLDWGAFCTKAEATHAVRSITNL